MKEQVSAEIGVIGGSGFYELLPDAQEIEVATPWGVPTSPITVGNVAGRTVAFLARHGRGHTVPPHMVNYRANLWALKSLGVRQLIGPTASGSLCPEIAPGHFVICDQLVDRTSGRKDTFYDGSPVTHISSADPYCPEMRSVVIEQAGKMGLTFHPEGTVVVIQGPRFSTKAESKWFSSMGWNVVNMTQYPEAVLARELELCYVNISVITDYDCGVTGGRSVTSDEMLAVFAEKNMQLKELVLAAVPALPHERHCPCANALAEAVV